MTSSSKAKEPPTAIDEEINEQIGQIEQLEQLLAMSPTEMTEPLEEREREPRYATDEEKRNPICGPYADKANQRQRKTFEPKNKRMSKISAAIVHLLEKMVFVLFWAESLSGEIAYKNRRRASLKKYQEVMDWVKTQNLLLDTACELPLPEHLAHITQRGSVFVLHTADDRYCILLKTWIFSGRENFWGTFYCDEPLSENDFRNYPYENKNCIRIEGKYNCIDKNGKEDYGLNFKELYVSRNHNDQLFEVYYTLN